MPRRRVNNQEPVRKRSRNGCDKCRLRKVRCDEAKPVCGQCCAKKLDCQTTTHLKWETDYQTVGRAFGRAGIWSKNSTSSSSSSPPSHIAEREVPWCQVPRIFPYSFVNATIGNVDQDLTTLEDRSGMTTASSGVDFRPAILKWSQKSRMGPNSPWFGSCRSPGVPQSIPAGIQYLPRLASPVHSYLLSYYLECICPLTVPTSVKKSPFASLVFPFSISASPTVLDSLLALAACHRSKTDISFKTMALQLSDKVLRTLRTQLSQEDAFQAAMGTEMLVVMMILCQFEIINESDKRWVVHLNGARDLIRVRRRASAHSDCKPISNDLVRFTEKYFAYQDVIGRTACGEVPAFGREFWTVGGDEADAWLGCSPELVATICDITDLSRQHSKDPSVSLRAEFQSEAASLESRLTSLKQRVHGDDKDDLLQTCAELKRLAAEVYLSCSVHGATPSTPQVRSHGQVILRLVKILLEHNISAGLNWPVFVAAVELDPLEDLEWPSEDTDATDLPRNSRLFILYALDKISLSVANISRTRAVIEKVWHAREFEDSSSRRVAKGQNGRNDWEHFVAPFCENMSLV